MRKWETINNIKYQISNIKYEDIVRQLLKNRGMKTGKEIEVFLNPPDPYNLHPKDVGIDKPSLASAIKRINKAIARKESVVVYADYDADGICAGAIMWETLYALGAKVMPYVPHRVEEGYGLSMKGIAAVRKQYSPTLIITVDHGITAKEKIAYAKKLGIDIIVTDHHVKPRALPRCTIVHTTKLSGAGVAWFLAKEIFATYDSPVRLRQMADPQGRQPTRSSPPNGGSSGQAIHNSELLALAAIGTIADMVPLLGPNRPIAKYGLAALNRTRRVGLDALIADALLTKGTIGTHEVSHILAPRLNAMGRIEHAIDALRLLCTKQKEKAVALAQKLGLTNRERQQLTVDTTLHAVSILPKKVKKLIFIAHEEYNQGVIGLVAGKLVEEYYRPAIVVAKGDVYSKASARSIIGFNIVEAIRSCSDILVDVGGHPMAAGFTVETKHLQSLQERLEQLAEKELDEEKLIRKLRIDAEIPLEIASDTLWKRLQELQPFGFGNPEPIFVTRKARVEDTRLVGSEGKHLKLRLSSSNTVTPQVPQFHSGQVRSRLIMDAIAFNQGELYGKLRPGQLVDIAYAIDMDTWNGNKRVQLKIKDIHPQ